MSGHLPIIYRLSSDLWPVNIVDSAPGINLFEASGSYCEVTLAFPAASVVTGNTVKISDSPIAGYNGIWRVIQQTASNKLVLEMPYLGAAAGAQLQRYYANYQVLVRVYAGIPAGHPLHSDRPISLRGTIPAVPDETGVVEVNVQGYVVADLIPLQNRLCQSLEAGEAVGNDTSMWTGFYIEYSEQYDEMVSGQLTTYQGSPWVAELAGGVPRIRYAANSVRQPGDFLGYSLGDFALATYSVSLRAKFLTAFERPVFFEPFEFDLQIISAFETLDGDQLVARLREFSRSGSLLETTDLPFPDDGPGLYRVAVSEHVFDPECSYLSVTIVLVGGGETVLSEEQFCDRRPACRLDGFYVRWLSWFGWEGWLFDGPKTVSLRSADGDTTRRDLTLSWDDAFRDGETEDDRLWTEVYDAGTMRSGRLSLAQRQSLASLQVSNKAYRLFLANDAGCGNYRQQTILIDRSTSEIFTEGPGVYEAVFSYRKSSPIRLQEN